MSVIKCLFGHKWKVIQTPHHVFRTCKHCNKQEEQVWDGRRRKLVWITKRKSS